MLTDYQVVSHFETAFAPLQCGTELYDYGSRVRFAVFDNGKPILRREGMLMRWLRREPMFEDLMKEVRRYVKKQGYRLMA
jgi:hypothetical protein